MRNPPPTTVTTGAPSLVAFGPLSPWPTPDSSIWLRTSLHEHPSFAPILESIQSLPSLWDVLVQNEPSLGATSGKVAARRLSEWASGTQVPDEKRNAMTMPMTVISQIVLYLHYLNRSDGNLTQKSIIDHPQGGIQGFCAGLLSALAVASATTNQEVARFAATSIKIAFCIGAYIDLDQLRNGEASASTIAVRWSAPATLETIQDLVSKYPDTYIAVIRDIRDVTITTSSLSASVLSAELSSKGFSVLDISLPGRYHSTAHMGIPRKIIEACEVQNEANFVNSRLVRSNTDGNIITSDNLALEAVESILVAQANWFSTISRAAASLESTQNSLILAVGNDAVPQSIARHRSVERLVLNTAATSGQPHPQLELAENGPIYPDNAVAVIGMSCKFPGADSVDEFWNVLSEGRSMLSQMPQERFSTKDLPRAQKDLRFWGNFVRDIEAFDHKFFKKSARESASMDPQQRLLMQVAYQALESSGYFSDASHPKDVGCYLGACSTDYDFNVASHPPTAYSTIGTLRAFLSGKLSHYFGWSGPSLTFDTACSSSAVAIHTACKALQTGECSQAIAGGVTLFTSPYLYENLATAHFLSPTGATKPFDASADGYCRGEGVGLVVLKKLRHALADGDKVLGVIAGSAINQNSNCVPITVPHSLSQGTLYQRAADQAGIITRNVDFVEAHGTGTPVGDPIEMESIRNIFGGSDRQKELYVSSVKGNIGHLEGASGVAAIIKAMLQMEHRVAFPQASFKSLNPKIPALGPDHMCIPTSVRDLLKGPLTACINNYGAAGSNATMMLMEAPRSQKQADTARIQPNKLPIRIGAASIASVLSYCKSLDRWITSHKTSNPHQLFSDLSYSLSRQQNQELPHMLTLSPSGIDQLQTQLRQQTLGSNSVRQLPKQPPVVLCFGGQGADVITLDRRVYEGSVLLRSHLDRCHEILCELGHVGIYPYIFESEPVKDVVALHSMLFATQYACAQSWIDAGLKVDALVGHSLGQITALSISGVLSLRDGLKFIAGRAKLMTEYWGSEPGTMVVVEADEEATLGLTNNLAAQDPENKFEIACYNGPKCHVVVSDLTSADVLVAEAVRKGIRHKRLNLEYGFHSRFTDDLFPHLEDLASSLEIHQPKIPLETCTDKFSWERPTAHLIAAHTRDPVFFTQAVQRVHERLGPSTWLEAGSNSTVVGLVGRIVGTSSESPNKFLPVALNKQSSFESVADTTVELWKRGHHLRFWGFHRLQSSEYETLRLPPYEFEKTKHWLELNTNQQAIVETRIIAEQEVLLPALIRLTKTDSQGHHFEVDPRSEEFKSLAKGHIFVGNAVCPVAVYVELIARALGLLGQLRSSQTFSVNDLQVSSPLKVDCDAAYSLELQQSAVSWHFSITGADAKTLHAHGSIALDISGPTLENEFSRYERVTPQEEINSMLADPASESIQGPMLYKMLANVAKYDSDSRGLKSIAAKAQLVAAKIKPPKAILGRSQDTTLLHPLIVDNFLQAALFHANCISDCSTDQAYILSDVERLQIRPNVESYSQERLKSTSWDLLAFTTPGNSMLTYDIFVYDNVSQRLLLMILGTKFAAVSRASPSATCNGIAHPRQHEQHNVPNFDHLEVPTTALQQPTITPAPIMEPLLSSKGSTSSIFNGLCELLEKVADIPRDHVKGSASFDDLGVDSLMMIEAISEISKYFDIDMPLDDLMELTDIDSLVQYLAGRGCCATDEKPMNEVPAKWASPVVNNTPSSVRPKSSSEAISKLSKLVTEHLEIDGELSPTANLADLGLDSLLAIELASDIKKMFAVEIELEQLDFDSTFEDLLRLVLKDEYQPTDILSDTSTAVSTPTNSISSPVSGGEFMSNDPQRIFDNIRLDFDHYSEQTCFKDFWKNVYPQQAELVLAYIAQAFKKLSCDLAGMPPGALLPSIEVLPKHIHLLQRLFKILVDGGVIERQADGQHLRTVKPINPSGTSELFQQMLRQYPKHTSETKLLNVTASKLAECLTGKAEPLRLLFANETNKNILADVYDNAPMCQATTRLLANFLAQAFKVSQSGGVFRILEVGAGTGGTARYLIDFLSKQGIKFEYTFTDISAGLVSAAKRKFRGIDQMKFMTLDCDQPAPPELCGQFHAVIATNCIHATSNATTSASNILPLLRDGGVFCLVEFTRGLYWFDLVYGLLEGWWLFSDGRQHALADEHFWDKSLHAAGFRHVGWTDGDSQEAQTMRLICAFKN